MCPKTQFLGYLTERQLWLWYPLLLFITLAAVTPGELSKVPFDAPEAETELAGGILVEYSGRNLALFSLADAVKTIVMTSLTVALFFPYNIS
ncbi:unnamed protein product, partial [marine sediment metagenome]